MFLTPRRTFDRSYLPYPNPDCRILHSLKPPNNIAVVVPTFSDSSNAPMQALKQRCSGARPLGLVKAGDNELLVIFDGKPFSPSQQTFLSKRSRTAVRTGMLHQPPRGTMSFIRLPALGDQGYVVC